MSFNAFIWLAFMMVLVIHWWCQDSYRSKRVKKSLDDAYSTPMRSKRTAKEVRDEAYKRYGHKTGRTYLELRKHIGERMAEGNRQAAKLREEGWPTPAAEARPAGVTQPKVLPTDFMPGGSRHGQPLNLPTMILTNKRPDELDPKTLQMIRDTGAIVLPGITSLEQLGDAFLEHGETLKTRHKKR